MLLDYLVYPLLGEIRENRFPRGADMERAPTTDMRSGLDGAFANFSVEVDTHPVLFDDKLCSLARFRCELVDFLLDLRGRDNLLLRIPPSVRKRSPMWYSSPSLTTYPYSCNETR